MNNCRYGITWAPIHVGCHTYASVLIRNQLDYRWPAAAPAGGDFGQWQLLPVATPGRRMQLRREARGVTSMQPWFLKRISKWCAYRIQKSGSSMSARLRHRSVTSLPAAILAVSQSTGGCGRRPFRCGSLSSLMVHRSFGSQELRRHDDGDAHACSCF